MPKYLVLIYGDEQIWDEATPEWEQENGRRHKAFAAEAGAAILASHELDSTSTAVSLHADPTGAPTPTDGPFLETKEIIGGYYLLETANLQEAVRLAGLIPEVTATHGGVEVRPIRQ